MTQAVRTIRIATQGPAGPAGLYPQPQWEADDTPYVRDTVLAHGGRIWLSLRETAVEPSAGAPDDWVSWLDFGSFAVLDENGKVAVAQLPAIVITDTFAAASQAEMLALAAQKGDIAIRSDLNRSFVLGADDASVLANWKELLTPTDAVLSVAGRTGAVTLSAGDVSGVALTANNLSDLGNAGTARTNLGLGAVATLNVGAGLGSGGGNLSANVTSVAGRTGAVTLAQPDIAGLTTASSPQFAGLSVGSGAGGSGQLNFGDVGYLVGYGSGFGAQPLRVVATAGLAISGSGDLVIVRDAAHTLAQRNGTNAQKANKYLTYTSATNFERLSIDAGQATANVIRLMAEKGSSGGSLRPIAIDGYSKSGAMVAADIPQGTWAVFKDTSGGGVVLGYNDGGALKTVALT